MRRFARMMGFVLKTMCIYLQRIGVKVLSEHKDWIERVDNSTLFKINLEILPGPGYMFATVSLRS